VRLLSEVIRLLEDRLAESTVSELAVSVPYTGVMLDGSSLGVCYTVTEGRDKNRSPPPGEAKGSSALELAKLALAPTGIESSIGVATLNAGVELPEGAVEGDPLDFLTLSPEDRVCVLGSFPDRYLEVIRESAGELWILERPQKLGHGLLPDWAVEVILPQCTILIATGSTIPNKTLERSLELASDARERVVVGASVPLLPEPFAKRGVTILAGVQFTDPTSAFRVVMEGGGTADLRPYSRKRLIRLRA